MEVFIGTGEDDLGNDVETWSAPTDVQVIAIQWGMVENINGYTSRVVSDVSIAVPPTLTVSVRDRFLLPGEDLPFEVIAVENANYGFHRWAPGSTIKLNRVTG